jgi:hypothetical protein
MELFGEMSGKLGEGNDIFHLENPFFSFRVILDIILAYFLVNFAGNLVRIGII